MLPIEEKIRLLKSQIIEVFEGVEYPGDDNLLHKDGCYNDDSEIMDFYGQTDWSSVPDKVIVFNNSSLCFFSPEAYQFYLPRFLIYTLEKYDSGENVVDNILYSLMPNGKDYDISLFKLPEYAELTTEQKKAIESCLESRKDDADDLKDFMLSKYSKFTEKQIKVIILFLELLRDDLKEDFDEDNVKAALQFWYSKM